MNILMAVGLLSLTALAFVMILVIMMDCQARKFLKDNHIDKPGQR